MKLIVCSVIFAFFAAEVLCSSEKTENQNEKLSSDPSIATPNPIVTSTVNSQVHDAAAKNAVIVRGIPIEPVTDTTPKPPITTNTSTSTTITTPTTHNNTTPASSTTPPTTHNNTTPATSTTPVTPTTHPTTVPSPKTTTPGPQPHNVTTTIQPNTTVVPTTTPVPSGKPDRKFDGLSFFAGIVLSAGLLAIGVVAYKFYEARRDRNYHTL